ncbi:MAG: RluA family pseudouridine synthase [Pseudomonadota bacterium]|nr:RluA family pseudouridine synthase [Pseudomonadota bacterium]
MPGRKDFTFCVDKSGSGKRLDVVVSSFLPSCSRSLAASLIRKGNILVQDNLKKPGYRVMPGDRISGTIPDPDPVRYTPEPIEIDILYQDSDIIVINKPSGIVVHPAPGHYSGTIVNALLFHCRDLAGIGGEMRPGIVHRLDKDTSGVLVAAKNDSAHAFLSFQFKERKIKKTYVALVHGSMEQDSGSIVLPIGRHASDRKKMSVVTRKPRIAETYWKVVERLEGVSLINIDLKTGRTHQIRVHCSAIKHPVVGDQIYGQSRIKAPNANNKEKHELLKSVKRQMLHAWRIRFCHPTTKKTMEFEAPIPYDMAELIDSLKEISRQKAEGKSKSGIHGS